MSEQMHLISFMINSPVNHTILSWAAEGDDRLAGLTSFAHWQSLAKTLERGCFDGVFFADSGIFDVYKNGPDEGIRYGIWPRQDPLALLPAMMAVTTHLGCAVTLSTAGTHPYQAVRTLSTLDCLSGGRVGWNVVTGLDRAQFRALGIEQTGHDERYDRADEFMEIAGRLWDGVAPDAVVMDKRTGRFANPEKVHRTEFAGKYFTSSGIPPTLRSPQGRPVIFQAGSSGRGQRFAAKHADVIFSIQPQLEGMQKIVRQLQAASEASESPRPLKVSFGILPIMGGTESEARRRRDDMIARIPIEAALYRLSGVLGIDLSPLDLDRPLEEMQTESSQGMMTALLNLAEDRRLTLRETATRYSIGIGVPQLIGTPEQIADEMERLWRGSGCHAFNVTPLLDPKDVNDFVDHVVPILQGRGILRREYAGTTFRENLLLESRVPTARG